jgi:hypothetical protein
MPAAVKAAQVRRRLVASGRFPGFASAGERPRLRRIGFRFDKERVQRNCQRSSQSIQKVDGGVSSFPLKFAHPRSIHSRIRCEPFLRDSPLGSQKS